MSKQPESAARPTVDTTAIAKVAADNVGFLSDDVTALVINSPEANRLAVGYLRNIAAVIKDIKGKASEIKRGIDAVKAIVLKQEKEALAPFLKADAYLREQTLAWKQHLDAEERARQQAIADQLRAAEAESALAAELGLEPVPVDLRATAVVVKEVEPAEDGFGFSRRYGYEVEDLKALVAAVHAGTVPLEALTINHEWMQARATELHEEGAIPGVRITWRDIPRVSAA